MALRLTPELKLEFCLLQRAASIDLKQCLNDPAALDVTIRDALRVYAEAEFYGPDDHNRVAPSSGASRAYDIDARLVGVSPGRQASQIRP